MISKDWFTDIQLRVIKYVLEGGYLPHSVDYEENRAECLAAVDHLMDEVVLTGEQAHRANLAEDAIRNPVNLEIDRVGGHWGGSALHTQVSYHGSFVE